MDTIGIAAQSGPASSAELSLEISRLVSRALGGEAIDTTAEGQSLAERYLELGMSGEMIGNAIARAIGMVGLIRSERKAAAPGIRCNSSDEEAQPLAAVQIAVSPAPGGESPAAAAIADIIDEKLAQAMSTEHAALIDPRESPILLRPEGAASADLSNTLPGGDRDELPSGQAGAVLGRLSKLPVAVVRRALFR